MKQVYFYVFIVLILLSCTVVKSLSKRTANRELSVFLTGQQQTDSIIKFSKKFLSYDNRIITPGKSFRVDANGVFNLADTIYIMAIMPKSGKVIYFRLDTQKIDSLMHYPDSLLKGSDVITKHRIDRDSIVLH